MSSIPGLGTSPEGGNGNPFQYSCQENPVDRGAWLAIIHGVAKSQIQLSTWEYTHTHTHTRTHNEMLFSLKEKAVCMNDACMNLEDMNLSGINQTQGKMLYDLTM